MVTFARISTPVVFTMTMVNALHPRQMCSESFQVCDPPGAITGTLGPIDAGWGRLYQDIIGVVNGYTIDDIPAAVSEVNPDGPARRDLAFCCSISADCLLIKAYAIPMCWDRFTTDVFFPDGTYGSVVSGEFNTSHGDSVNLVYGDYTMKDGSIGNIFSDNAMSSMKPNIATMSRPQPWTSSGIGSAIPAVELGTSASLSTGVITVAATTVARSTGDSITIIATLNGCENCPPHGTTIKGPVQAASTLPAHTSTFTTGILAPTGLVNQGVVTTAHTRVTILLALAYLLTAVLFV